MTDFIVNEVNHVVDMEEHAENLLSIGEKLPDGQIIAELNDYASNWQLFITEDGSFYVLAVKKNLVDKWVSYNLVPKSAFSLYENQKGEIIYLLMSPSSLVLQASASVKFEGLLRSARSFATALWYTRLLMPNINLRDSIYCELYSVLLPTFTSTRSVADVCIFENALRLVGEDIYSVDELDEPYLNYFNFKTLVKKYGLVDINLEPYYQLGEMVDEVLSEDFATITGLLDGNDNYQIFNTNKDFYVLLIEKFWGQKLITEGLLDQMATKTVLIGGFPLYALKLSKRHALESFSHRHFGLTEQGAIKLARAIYRFYKAYPSANLDDALYVEELNLIWPLEFDGYSKKFTVLQRSLENGPFAMAPFSYELIDDAMFLASAIRN